MVRTLLRAWGLCLSALLAVAGTGTVLLPSTARAQAPAGGAVPARQAEATPDKLVPHISPEQFERLHKLIKPQPGEWKFLEVPWVATVGEARQKAAKEGKPLLVWYMVGEPLGQC